MVVQNIKFICDHVFWRRDPLDFVVPFYWQIYWKINENLMFYKKAAFENTSSIWKFITLDLNFKNKKKFHNYAITQTGLKFWDSSLHCTV